MGKKKYVAYVGTYTHGTSKGIQVYDVNVEDGTLTERSEVQVSNASYDGSLQEWQVSLFHRTRELLFFKGMRTETLQGSTVWTLMV